MALTQVDQGLLGQYAQYTGFKNRIINGAMMIDQRNNGASITPASGQYLVDRWQAALAQSAKFSTQQNAGAVTPPAGFTNYLGVTSLSAYSVLSADYFWVSQKIEGFNTADLAWGTSSASAVTLSFRVYSSLTGTFGGAVCNSPQNRSYPFSYTIPTANTWTTVSVTVPGDTAGSWVTNNGIGIQIIFSLGVGSTYAGAAGSWAGTAYYTATGATSVVGTNGATFYITGVQLEKGSTATSFDYRPYGTELALCQRYYYRNTPGAVSAVIMGSITTNGTSGYAFRALQWFPVEMRTAPSALEQSGTASDYAVVSNNAVFTSNAVPIFTNATTKASLVEFSTASGATSGASGYARATNTTAYLGWSAEL